MKQDDYKKHVLGITGGVGSGKSTALAYLEKRYGAYILQCDDIARCLQEKGGACYEDMCSMLGESYLNSDDSFNRQKIAEAAFGDPDFLNRLNAIVHPAVFSYVEQQIARSDPDRLIVVEAALLIETGYKAICDELWYIRTSPEIRAERLKASRSYTKERIEKMFASQKSDAYYAENTALTITNDSDDPAQMYAQIDIGLRMHDFIE